MFIYIYIYIYDVDGGKHTQMHNFKGGPESPTFGDPSLQMTKSYIFFFFFFVKII
jgi:hypothetical protein